GGGHGAPPGARAETREAGPAEAPAVIDSPHRRSTPRITQGHHDTFAFAPDRRLFTGSGARSLVVALCADLTFMYLFELVAGDLCGPVTWSGATSAVAHLSLLGSAGVAWPGAAGCRDGWRRRGGGVGGGAGGGGGVGGEVGGRGIRRLSGGGVRQGWRCLGCGGCSFLVRAHRARSVPPAATSVLVARPV